MASPSSKKPASSADTPAPPPDPTTPPTPPETDEQRQAREDAEKAAAQAAADQEKDNEKRKGNLAKVEDPETYNPYLDPDVPDSNLADVINAELKGGGESPTLQALREAKKEAEKKDAE